MHIGILGTGALAAALGGRWSPAGHDITIAGRSPAKVHDLAARLSARPSTIREAVRDADAVLLAIAWDGVADVLREAGHWAGTVLIDPTNAVEHGIGVLRTPPGESGAQRIAALAPGAQVVKAFHLFPAEQWSDPTEEPADGRDLRRRPARARHHRNPDPRRGRRTGSARRPRPRPPTGRSRRLHHRPRLHRHSPARGPTPPAK